MSRSIEIPIEKIVFIPEVYPRSETDQKRVREFAEAMECGEQFPPLKVARDGKRYVLLDGKHRLEAMKIRSEEKGNVDILPVPERYWLLAAVMYNHKSSKPLTRGEVKVVIMTVWERGIRSVNEIAERIGCSAQYVRRIMKPVRDEDLRERSNEILVLRAKGLTQDEIAKKLGIHKSTVSRTLQKETVSFCNKPGASCMDQVLGDTNNLSFSVNPGNPSSPKKYPQPDLPDIEAQSPPIEGQSDPNHQQEPFSSCLPEVFPNNELQPSERDSLRAIELVKRYHLDIVDIMDHIEKPAPWIRKTLMAAMALALQPITPKALSRVAIGLGMDHDQAKIIQENLLFAKSFSPISEHLPQWVEDNLSLKDVALIVELSGTDKDTLPYLLKGENPPEQQADTHFEMLPDQYKEGFNATAALFRRVRDDLKKRRFKGKSGAQLLRQMNRTRILFNEVYDAMLACNREGLF